MRLSADQKLVQRLLKRDERAFEQFFNTYFSRLFRFALTRVDGHEDQAEEATQRALCKALDKLATYRGEAPLFSWLCTFCRHETYALVKDQLRDAVPVAEEDPVIRSALEMLSGPQQMDPQRLLGKADVERIVHQTLDSLPTLYSRLLEWKYFHGLSVKEIAQKIDKGNKATESLLTRSRAAFRNRIGDISASCDEVQPDYLS